jgi:hypothetical protein
MVIGAQLVIMTLVALRLHQAMTTFLGSGRLPS